MPEPTAANPHTITLCWSPEQNFGQVSLLSTRAPAPVVLGALRAGDTPETVAAEYGLSVDEVRLLQRFAEELVGTVLPRNEGVKTTVLGVKRTRFGPVEADVNPDGTAAITHEGGLWRTVEDVRASAAGLLAAAAWVEQQTMEPTTVFEWLRRHSQAIGLDRKVLLHLAAHAENDQYVRLFDMPAAAAALELDWTQLSDSLANLCNMGELEERHGHTVYAFPTYEARHEEPMMNRKEGRLLTSQLPDAVMRAAAEHGHTFESDPPAALTSMLRWTCTQRECGRAILVRPDGTAYGSATTEDCGSWD